MLKINHLSVLLLLAMVAQPAVHACGVVKLTAQVGSSRFEASGVILEVRRKHVVVTTDHFLPIDDFTSSIRASMDGNRVAELKIQKRDWASDLMILKPSSDSDLKALDKLQPCHPNTSPKALEHVTLRGYPVQSEREALREAVIGDLVSPEIRLARPLSQVKVIGLAEKGMSGGPVVDSNGALVALMQNEWTSMNHELKGGALALSARDLFAQAERMLLDRGETAEMPLPFAVRRAEAEIQVAGFRFRDRPGAPILLAMGGGGHPDGIGGEAPGSGLEVVGLTGETVPEQLRLMERVLRRAQSKGGSQMLVRSTLDEQAVPNLAALARMVLVSEQIPSLDFSLKNVVARRSLNAPRTPESLFEEAIVGISILANTNPRLQPFATSLRQSYERWMKTSSYAAAEKLFGEERRFKPELDSIMDLDPGLWPTVLDFQTTLLQLRKELAI